MTWIKSYLLGLVAAAVLCAMITQLVGKKDIISVAIKLLCAVFMLLALVSPITKLRISAPEDLFADISYQADAITTAAAASTQNSISAIIKEKTQAYILDKASQYGLNLTVEVILSDGSIPEPVGVQLTGNISPYNKRILSSAIEQDLGIPAEAQIWN